MNYSIIPGGITIFPIKLLGRRRKKGELPRRGNSPGGGIPPPPQGEFPRRGNFLVGAIYGEIPP